LARHPPALGWKPSKSADVDANAHGCHPLPKGQDKGKNRSPLAIALEQSPDVARMLLDSGEWMRWWWKDEKYVLGRNGKLFGILKEWFEIWDLIRKRSCTRSWNITW
jgi:hypothetical protein